MSVPAPPYRATIYLTRMKPRREATIVIPDDWPLPFADNEALDLDGIKVWIHHASQPRRVPIFAGVAVLEFPEAFGARAGDWYRRRLAKHGAIGRDKVHDASRVRRILRRYRDGPCLKIFWKVSQRSNVLWRTTSRRGLAKPVTRL